MKAFQRPPARSVEDLEVFKLAHALVLRVYELTRRFETADHRPVVGEVCGPVQIQIAGFRPIAGEVVFIDMPETDEPYEPLVGYMVLEASQAAVDMVGHRLTHVRYMDLKAALGEPGMTDAAPIDDSSQWTVPPTFKCQRARGRDRTSTARLGDAMVIGHGCGTPEQISPPKPTGSSGIYPPEIRSRS